MFDTPTKCNIKFRASFFTNFEHRDKIKLVRCILTEIHIKQETIMR